MLAAWLAGDLAALQKDVLTPLRRSAPAFYAKLVREHNVRWTRTIVERLKGSGDTVVVVGMGHLVGPDGLPARLRARGLDVQGPR